MSRREKPRLNAWEGDERELAQIADEIYGASEGPALEGGRVVARPTPIGEIWADVKQPRRAVPASIRLHWDGSPAQVAGLLDEWLAAAERLTGAGIDPRELVAGRGEGLPVDEWPALARDYVELCRLAASIRADGLLNPINVAQIGRRTVIIAGERRWLAYWLLAGYTEDAGYLRIPAQTVSDVDHVWKQAAENTARRQLNAIGMARQLALLIMAARQDEGYQAFEEVVTPGVCDRRYYAQVADGNVHRIPKGMGERIQAAMGLSMTQLSQYRNLLHLTDDDQVNDALWLRGDVEDWPEKAFREVSTLTGVKVREIVTGPNEWTLDDLRNLTPRPPLHEERGSYPAAGPRIWGDGRVVTAEEEAALEQANRYVPFSTGDAVVVPGGGVGRVLGVSGGMARVRRENGTSLLLPVGRLRRVADAPVVDEWPEGSETGMAAEVIHTGETGVIERRYTDKDGRRFLFVNIGGYSAAKALEEVRLLEMSWPDFLREEADEGGIEMLDDGPVGMPAGMRPGPATRGNLTPLPPLPEERGSNTPDKAVSATPIWYGQTTGITVLLELRRYAQGTQNTDALAALRYLFALTQADVRALGDDFGDEIGPRYDAVMNCMVDVVNGLFDLLEAARE